MKKFIAIAITLCCSLPLRAQEQVMYAHFIDMGQGLATLLQFPKGIVMIDAGSQIKKGKEGSQKKVMAYLNKFFKANPQYHYTIDALIVTHNHEDHFGSILPIYTSGTIKIKSIVTTRHYLDAAEDVDFVLSDNGIKRYFVEYADVIAKAPNGVTNSEIDPLEDYNGVNPEIRIFSGRNKEWEAEDKNENPNFHSLGIRVRFGTASFFFIGDMEKPAINYMLKQHEGHENVFDVDVYQVGHHGSENATNAALLDAMSPKIAIISASHKNDTKPGSGYSYGHPNEKAVDLIASKMTGTRKLKNGYVYNGKKNVKDKSITVPIFCTCWDNTIVNRGGHGRWVSGNH